MLLFIFPAPVFLPESYYVSIHLMLLFIFSFLVMVTVASISFNTSHVTLYRSRATVMLIFADVSIHLMLLFIPEIITDYIQAASFNTSHVTLYRSEAVVQMQPRPGFNTSHVTLYPPPWLRWSRVPSFQYISCYSLSFYSLSSCGHHHRFNTSHVTLYRDFCMDSKKESKSFNTSHVTLYRRLVFWSTSYEAVSIHLMLLFIEYWI